MYTKKKLIAALAKRFQEQLPSYKKSDYNETLTRKEDKIRIGSAIKAPDYSFQVAGWQAIIFYGSPSCIIIF